MTTTLSNRSQSDAESWREQTKQRRDERREAVIALLDRVDRPMAFGMGAAMIAERSGLLKHSVAQTLGILVREGVALRKIDAKSGNPVYFLTAPAAQRRAYDAKAADAIALYRAEKQRRIDRHQVLLAEAKQDLDRRERVVNEISAAKRKRGAQRAGETTKRKAAERRQQHGPGIAIGWKDASR
jgi:hypothetical protein